MARRIVSLTDEEIEFIKVLALEHPEEYSRVRKLVDKLNGSQQRITRASAKGKGRSFQQWVCRWVSELLGVPYVQSDDSCEIHSREMGQHGSDIVLRGEARKRFPFDIECKAVKGMSLQAAVDQAEANAADCRWGCVFYKQTNQKPLVIFSLETFGKVCKRLLGREEDK